MSTRKRLLAMALVFAICLSVAGIGSVIKSAKADSFDQSLVNKFTDIKGHWAYDGLESLIGYGYLYGTTSTTAAPDKTLTLAELSTIVVRILGGSEKADISGFVDMDKGAWYYDTMAQAVYMGIIPTTNTNYLNPNREATREYAAYMLARAFGLTVREPIDNYSDADKVSDWALSSMQAMAAVDAITSAGGKSSRYLNPQEAITRGEFAMMIYAMTHDFIKETDSSNIRRQTFDDGVVVSKGGVTFTDCTIKGNLYIADGVGRDDITLRNTTVEGNIYARGGGDRSIHIEEGSKATSVVVLNPYNASRIVVDEDSTITGVLINNAVDEVLLEGNVGTVVMNVSDVDLEFDTATAESVVINSADSTVTVDKDTTIGTMSIASASTGVTVKSEGTISRLANMANDATLDMDGKLSYLLVGAVSGMKLDLDSDVDLATLDMHCSDSEITINSKVNALNFSAFAEGSKLTIGKEGAVGTLTVGAASTGVTVDEGGTVSAVVIDAPKFKGTLALQPKTMQITASASEADITLVKGTTIDELTVAGAKAKVTVDTEATVTKVAITGEGVELTGKGTVKEVAVAKTGKDVAVTTGSTAVSNAGAENVKAGGQVVPTGKTYTTTSAGTDVVKNNDGTPDTDGDPTTGAEAENMKATEITVAVASSLTPTDIDVSGTWALSDLYSGMNFETVKDEKTGAVTYKVTGDFKNTADFGPTYDIIAGSGTGFYLPIVVDVKDAQTGWTAMIDAHTYTASAVQLAGPYAGKLLVWLQFNPSAATKTISVMVDADGSEKVYGPYSTIIDYSGITFDGVADAAADLVSYPIRATARDLTSNGAFELSDFGTFVFTKGTANTVTVTGTAKKLDAVVRGNVTGESEYYIPVLINTSAFKSGWSVATDASTRFTASNTSNGTAYRGQLVLLLAYTADGPKTTTIYFDTDGDGRTDANASYTIDVTGVAVDGGSTPAGSWDKIPVDFSFDAATSTAGYGHHDTYTLADWATDITVAHGEEPGQFIVTGTVKYAPEAWPMAGGDVTNYVLPLIVDAPAADAYYAFDFGTFKVTHTAGLNLMAFNVSPSMTDKVLEFTYYPNYTLADVGFTGSIDFSGLKFENPPRVSSVMTISIPTEAVAADLTDAAELEFSDFGDVSGAPQGDGNVIVTGKLYNIADDLTDDSHAIGPIGSEYWLPIRFSQSDTTSGAKLTINDYAYTGDYGLFPIRTGRETITVAYDADGDGERFAPVTLSMSLNITLEVASFGDPESVPQHGETVTLKSDSEVVIPEQVNMNGTINANGADIIFEGDGAAVVSGTITGAASISGKFTLSSAGSIEADVIGSSVSAYAVESTETEITVERSSSLTAGTIAAGAVVDVDSSSSLVVTEGIETGAKVSAELGADLDVPYDGFGDYISIVCDNGDVTDSNMRKKLPMNGLYQFAQGTLNGGKNKDHSMVLRYDYQLDELGAQEEAKCIVVATQGSTVGYWKDDDYSSISSWVQEAPHNDGTSMLKFCLKDLDRDINGEDQDQTGWNYNDPVSIKVVWTTASTKEEVDSKTVLTVFEGTFTPFDDSSYVHD